MEDNPDTPVLNDSSEPPVVAADGPSLPPPGFPPTTFNDRMRRVFNGPTGLRAGWRFLIYLIMVVALIGLFSWLLRTAFPPTGHRPPFWLQLLVETAVTVGAFVPAVIMGFFEKRSFADYGLPGGKAFGKDFWVGALWGLAALSLLLLAIRGAGDFTLSGLSLHGLRILKFAAFWGVFFLLVGFFEEFLFRGYSLATLTSGMGFWPSALTLSALFGLIHLGNAGEAWIGALAAGLIGLFFCFTLRRTGSLWFAVGMHATWDWAESYFYSVPDSGSVSPGHLLNTSFHGSRWITGGSVGPEGSVFVLVLIAIMWVAFNWAYPAREYEVRGF
jgi:membrane protease YdiL (CAAX protease family)